MSLAERGSWGSARSGAGCPGGLPGQSWESARLGSRVEGEGQEVGASWWGLGKPPHTGLRREGLEPGVVLIFSVSFPFFEGPNPRLCGAPTSGSPSRLGNYGMALVVALFLPLGPVPI